MNEELYSFISSNSPDLDSALRAHLPISSLPGASRLNDALAYALFPGGKRLRPVLSLLASEIVGVSRSEGIKIACAVEFVHSSSIIIDDMPGMDDANLRRKKSTLHVAFGEGVALLAALALLNKSYALFADAACSFGHADAAGILVSEATRAIGPEGMIGGQAIDLELRADRASARTLVGRDLKTVALMRLMMTAGAIACCADRDDTAALADFGECFGRAYQICDDLLDEEANGYLSGKTTGQDVRHGRANAVSTLGAACARRTASELIERGAESVKARFGLRFEARILTYAARYILERLPDTSSNRFPLPTVSRNDTVSVGD